jgi:hypothetical protein
MTRCLAAAPHEAAHAIVAAHFGLRIESVSIEQTAGNLGTCSVAPRTGRELQYLVMLGAGQAADQILKSPDASCGASGDRGIAYELGWTYADWRPAVALARNLLRGELKAAWLATTDALALSDLSGRHVRAILRRYR